MRWPHVCVTPLLVASVLGDDREPTSAYLPAVGLSFFLRTNKPMSPSGGPDVTPTHQDFGGLPHGGVARVLCWTGPHSCFKRGQTPNRKTCSHVKNQLHVHQGLCEPDIATTPAQIHQLPASSSTHKHTHTYYPPTDGSTRIHRPTPPLQ